MKYFIFIIIIVVLGGCDNSECFDENSPVDFYDHCNSIPGTPQYKKTHPAECPWPEKNGKCVPPEKKT